MIVQAPVFSNATEWDQWRAEWCNRCVCDRDADCDIVTDMLFYITNPNIVRFDINPTQTVCLGYTSERHPRSN